VRPEDYVRKLLERELSRKNPASRPLKSFYGVLAKYGPASTAEEIAENRAEMLRDFPREAE